MTRVRFAEVVATIGLAGGTVAALIAFRPSDKAGALVAALLIAGVIGALAASAAMLFRSSSRP